MAVFTKLNELHVAEMLQNYELGELVKLTPIHSGTENTNYFIEMMQNNHSTEYLLTIFERLEAHDLPFYLNYTAYLAQQGVCVPSPIATKTAVKNNHTLVSQSAQNLSSTTACIYLNQQIKNPIFEKPWAVVEKLAGQSVMQAHAIHVAQVAQNLAKMHCVSENYPHKQENLRGMNWWERTIPKIYSFLDARKNNLLVSEFETLQNFYQSKLYQQLPKSIAHCDLFRDNVMFKPLDINTPDGLKSFKNFEPYYKDLDHNRAIQLSGFFDFYFAAYETMLYDICITINDWCMTVDHSLDPILTHIFFTEYQKIRTITDVEKEALNLMFRAASMRFWVSRLFDWHMPREASFFQPHPPERFEIILRYHLNTKVEING
jgi:homoserine kinase type II